MPTLSTELRNKLERAIVEARDVAEAGAKAAFETLAVHQDKPYPHMSPEERQLRNHLRAHARQLGDRQDKGGKLEITHLVWECAYEHWHRMLFARFLSENDLLIEPETGVAISLEECEELAKEEGTDLWTLASRFAQRMLPQIFRPDDPVLKVSLALEHQLKLERLLEGLESAVFTASDALGWVYQFWQTKRKKQVNESGAKIGADELPAVTQLFTEPYMVNFLIHNTLGAWHAGKVLAANPDLAKKAKSEEDLRRAVALPGVSWDYLRFIRSDDGKGPWQPAAGTFEGWPKRAAELKILDPCCGSGHFLVTLLHHLVPIRIEEDNTSAMENVDAVIRDNLYGLEIDECCTQIAAFALALAAWTYPGASGYRPLLEMGIACSGIAPNTKKEDWIALAGDQERLQRGMTRLYDLFQDAPTLGSLTYPPRVVAADLMEAGFEELHPYFEKIISQKSGDYDEHEMGIAACGIADAAQILGDDYHLVITNVPYLGRGKQDLKLKTYLEHHHADAKHDLATVMIERGLISCGGGGSIAMVTPQNWLFLRSYIRLRKSLLANVQLNLLAKLGPGAFETIGGEVVNVVLLVSTATKPSDGQQFAGLDASYSRDAKQKAAILRGLGNYQEQTEKQNKAKSDGPLHMISQKEQFENPDARIVLESIDKLPLLEKYADCFAGILNGDSPRFQRMFWEIVDRTDLWVFQQTTVRGNIFYGGLEKIIFFDAKNGHLRESKAIRRERLHDSDQRGNRAWGKQGVAVSQMNTLPVALYTGEKFDSNVAVIYPEDQSLIPAIWEYCKTPRYHDEVRKIDQKVNVTNASLTKVPFDIQHWQNVAKRKYPKGLPEPRSDDPSQWLFHGRPEFSVAPLLVTVARLLDYRWPAETDQLMRLSVEGQGLVGHCMELATYADLDGIVCIPSIRGENPAAERLRALLAAAYGKAWSPAKEAELTAATGSKAKDLDEWLRNDFFEHHCRLFHHRPFVWHIWDGRSRDGFHALVNYHKLAEGGGKGRRLLENLTYSYLGDWISRQKDGIKRGEGGAEDRLAAAVELQKRLEAILKGEQPFDIFVRWKPIEEQAIGWEPDINDGVRLNIRPFMINDFPGGRKGAGILRWKPNIKWGKDRGKEQERPKEQYPWFWEGDEFTGNRLNDIHLTNEEKLEARGSAKR